MLYKLDHLYAINHEKSSYIVEIDLMRREIIELTSALEFLFEDLVGSEFALDKSCLVDILCKYYGAEELTLRYKNRLKRIVESEENDYVDMVSFPDGIEISCIDLYFARESQCGPGYKELIAKWVSEENRNNISKMLLQKGKEI